MLAATPLISATSLAACLGVTVKSAIRLLDGLAAAGIAVEITRRSKRRLFGLEGMAPLGAAVRPPYRPEPGRGRGRPRLDIAEHLPETPPPPPPSLTPIERRAFDYTALEEAMEHLDAVVRNARHALRGIAEGAQKGDAGHPGIAGQD